MRYVRLKSGGRVTADEAREMGLEKLAAGFGRFHSHYVNRQGLPVCGHAVDRFERDDSTTVTCGTCRRIEASPTSRLKIQGAL